VLCPVRTQKWVTWLRGILEKNGAIIMETTPEKHDHMMAVIQGLNHFNTIIMGLVLSRAGVSFSELCRFETPAFQAKTEIIRKVFCQNPTLYAEIVTMNPDIRQLIEEYEKKVAEMKNLIFQGNSPDIADIIARHAAFFKLTVP
jgi:prephenate dehydrogenase